MELKYCPGLLSEGYTQYSPLFLRRMFSGKKVSHILPYNAPEADEEDHQKFMENQKRISISGVQEKYALILKKNTLRLTEEKERGTYILKPKPHGLKRAGMVPANEHLTMQIAAQVYQIKTAENGIVFFKNNEPAYITRRFDIGADGRRLGMEDFASLAGKTEANTGKNFKYNYSYEGVAELIRQYVGAWKVEMEKYFKLVIFNFIFSNGDAHLKNFSLLETINGDYLLSPAYDLLNTRIHVSEEHPFALDDDLFKEWNWSDCSIQHPDHCPCKEDFIEFGKAIKISERRVIKLLTPFLEEQPGVMRLIDRSFLDQETKSLYRQHYQERLEIINLAGH